MRHKGRAVIGAAGVIAVTAVYSRRRNRPPVKLALVPKPSPTVSVVKLVLLWQTMTAMASGSWGVSYYPPRSYWTDTWFVSISGAARSVLNIIGIFLGPVVDLVSSVWSVITNTISGVWDDITNLGLWVYDLGSYVGQTIGNLVQYVTNIATPLIHAIVDPIARLAQEAFSYADSIAENLWSYVAGPVGTFVDAALTTLKAWVVDLLGGIVDFINDPIGFLKRIFEPIIADAIAAALDALSFAGELAAKIVDAGLSFALAVPSPLDVLRKIWHIFIWLAENVADIATDGVEGLLSTGISGTETLVQRVINDDAGDLETYVSHLFGLN